MANIGDKFIIEIAEKYMPDGFADDMVSPNILYRAKGFDSLVFDDKGIRKLEPCKESTEDAYRRGMKDAWDAARKVIAMWHEYENQGILDRFEIDGTWGESVLSILFLNQTPEHAIKQIKKFEDEQKRKIEAAEKMRISVGDECYHIDNPDLKFVVIKIDIKDTSGLIGVVFQDGNCEDIKKDKCIKTGRRFPEIVRWYNEGVY